MNRALIAPYNCFQHVWNNFWKCICTHTECVALFFSLQQRIYIPPPLRNAHTPRGLIRLNMYVCVCGLCIVGVEDGDALKKSSGSTDASALSSLSLQTIASATREPRHWRRRPSSTPPSPIWNFTASVRVVVVYLTGARFCFFFVLDSLYLMCSLAVCLCVCVCVCVCVSAIIYICIYVSYARMYTHTHTHMSYLRISI